MGVRSVHGGRRCRARSGVNRGVVYWEDAGGRDARILVGAGFTLFALDAATGRPIESFGTKRRRRPARRPRRRGPRRSTSSPTRRAPSTSDLLIQGTRVGEGPGPSAPGYVRAYDVRTGAIAWTFHTIPQPGEPGHDTWPADAWTRVGGANSWSGVTSIAARGLVFLPTGSAAFDFWGGNRKGDNLYANSLLVLKADTGAYVWHYQFVRHDIWDRDLPQAPVLVTVRRDGRAIPAVAQATKTGHVYVFDRETGAPLFPMEEQAVPPSDVEGEAAAATQPVPTAPPAVRAAAVLGRPDHRPVARGRRQRARALAGGAARQHLGAAERRRARSSSPASTAAPNGAARPTTSAPGCSTSTPTRCRGSCGW